MRNSGRVFVGLAGVIAFIITMGIVRAPAFTDAYYHFNAANRIVTGLGFTDAYVWTYIGAVSPLPMPSHLYWMPMTSTLAALGMAVFNAPDQYWAAQVPLAILLWFTAGAAFWLGRRWGGTERHAWAAGLLTLFSPFFIRFWGATDTFAPYAAWGSACLLMMGMAMTQPRVWRWGVVGALAGLAHLTRADGVLLLMIAVGFAVIARLPFRLRAAHVVALIVAYSAMMTPFFARNLAAIGTPLPLGGTQAIWFDEYNDIFNFPPDSSPQTLFVKGLDSFIASRREAFANNAATLIAVEGVIVLLPFMLIGGWVRRRDPSTQPFWVYALGLHLAMTFVFPYPGYRGGLFHSSAALIPFWSVFAIIGMDSAIDWLARRRRRWRARHAKHFFTGAAVLLAFGLSVFYAINGHVPPHTSVPVLYQALSERLPAASRILYDDPAELYYFTGFGGATLPNASPEALLVIARKFDIDYLVLKNDPAASPASLLTLIESPPNFLVPLDFEYARLYAFRDR